MSKEETKELKKISSILEKISVKDRYFIYSARPFKFFLYNFLAGIAHGFGRALGTIIFLVIVGIVLRQILVKIDFQGTVNRWLQQLGEQINKQELLAPPLQ
ncbi:hypothetical protein J7J95_02210 [bacterium]|nr:hypothetical protein [bacterium]